jgi:hypothetical protein
MAATVTRCRNTQELSGDELSDIYEYIIHGSRYNCRQLTQTNADTTIKIHIVVFWGIYIGAPIISGSGVDITGIS